MGDSAGGSSSELTGEKLCKMIEEGEVVSYNLMNGKLVKSIYRNNKWREVPV